MITQFDTHLIRLFPYGLIPLASSLFIFFITLSVFLRSYRVAMARLVFIFFFMLAIWLGSSAFMMVTPVREWAESAVVFYFFSWLLLPPVFLSAVFAKTGRRMAVIVPVTGVFLFFAVWFGLMGHSRLLQYYFGFYPHLEGITGIILLVLYYFTVGAGLLMLWDFYRDAATNTSRNQARLLWLGASIAFLLAIPESILLIARNPITLHNRPAVEHILSVIIVTLLISIGYIISLLLMRINIMKGHSVGRNRRLLLVLVLFFLPVLSLVIPLLSRIAFTTYPVSGVGAILGTVIIIIASIKYRLMDIAEIFRRYLVYYLMLAVWLIAYISFISRYTSRENIAPMITVGLFLVIIFNPFYRLFHRITDSVLFKNRYDYQKTLKKISRDLVTVLDRQKLLDLIRSSIVNVLKASSFTLFLYEQETDSFVSVEDRNFSYGLHDPAVNLMILANRPVYAEELGSETDNSDMNEFVSLFKDTNSVLAVPMVYKGMLRGIMCLGDRESGEIYNLNDVELLEILANQSIIALDNARLYELAITDELTNLYIIRFFNQRIVDELVIAIRMKRMLSLLMIDIDFFKAINDTHGHQAGDLVLKEVASIIETEVRAIDLVARYGGEEFAVILPETENSVAEVVAERIRKKIENTIFRQDISLTVSIGIASIDGARPSTAVEISQELGNAERKKFFGELKETFIYHADKGLYTAKNGGRNRIINNGVLKI